MLISRASPVIVLAVVVIIVVLDICIPGLIIPRAPAFPPMFAVAVGFLATDEAEARATLAVNVIASFAELDASLACSAGALLPVFATLEAQESLSALFVGWRFAETNVLEHVVRIVVVILADHACDIPAVQTSTATKDQYAILDALAPRADEGTACLEERFWFTVTDSPALDVVLTVYAFGGRSVVLDLLVPVFRDVLCR